MNDLNALIKTGVPVWFLILTLFASVLVFFLMQRYVPNQNKQIQKICLIEYVIIVISSTIVFRTSADDYDYNFTPFWSYYQIKHNLRPYLVYENLLNVILFIPIGLLVASIQSAKLYVALLFGCIFSICIEICQFVFKCGLCEVDDIIHNTIGAAIGIIIYQLFRFFHCFFRDGFKK